MLCHSKSLSTTHSWFWEYNTINLSQVRFPSWIQFRRNVQLFRGFKWVAIKGDIYLTDHIYLQRDMTVNKKMTTRWFNVVPLSTTLTQLQINILWAFSLLGCHVHLDQAATQRTQNICITFVRRRPNVFDVGPFLYKCYTDVSCLLGIHPLRRACVPHALKTRELLFESTYPIEVVMGGLRLHSLITPCRVVNQRSVVVKVIKQKIGHVSCKYASGPRECPFAGIIHDKGYLILL